MAASSAAAPHMLLSVVVDDAENVAASCAVADSATGVGTGAGRATAATGAGALPRGAVQLSVSPPSLPAQFHDQGPVPDTCEDLPRLQRLSLGASVAATPLAVPHAPLTLA